MSVKSTIDLDKKDAINRIADEFARRYRDYIFDKVKYYSTSDLEEMLEKIDIENGNVFTNYSVYDTKSFRRKDYEL